jgi:hypothetical protein
MFQVSRIIRLLLIDALFLGAALFAQSGPGAGSGSGSGSGTSGGGSGSGGPGAGQTTPVIALKIPNETVPPGGVAQMKFLNTEPTPISSGRPHGFFDASMFDDVLGIQLFDMTGDLNGVALVTPPWITVAFEASGAVQGTDYPVMTMAMHVRSDARPGATSQFDLDAASAFYVGGVQAIINPIAPATITVGGTISITNVVPGGGLQPGGAVVKVVGLGFQAHTQVQLNGVQAQSVEVVSPTEIDITLSQATDMTGKKIQVVNPDGSQDTYFSYLRGVNLGASNHFLLTTAVPIFSAVTHSHAIFTGPGTVIPTQYAGLAMQNANLQPANVTVSLFDATGRLLGQSTIPVPSGYRLMRGIEELVGAAPSAGSYAVVSSDQPIQVFGFVADDAQGTVTPFAPSL